MLTGMTKKEIAEWLIGWFRDTAGVENRWRRDPVGIVIKGQLKALKHWKDQQRGNAAKGRAVQQYGRE